MYYRPILAEVLRSLSDCMNKESALKDDANLLERANTLGFRGNYLADNYCEYELFSLASSIEIEYNETVKPCIKLWGNNTGFDKKWINEK